MALVPEPWGTLAVRVGPLLTLILAFWAVGRAAERSAWRFGLSGPLVAGLTSGIAVAAVVTGRLVAVAPHWRVTAAHPVDLLRVTDRLSFYGAVGGALGWGLFRALRGGLPPVAVAGLYGAAAPLGFAVYGAGCLLRDDCYGRAAPPPFGIVFPGLTTARYPVELYAAAVGLITFAVAQSLVRRRVAPAVVALLAVGLLAGSRAGLDLLRMSADGRLMRGEQLLSATIAVAALVLVLALLMGDRLRAAGLRRPALGRPRGTA